MNELLGKLNKQQQEAVIHDSGPLLIVAGAGTGKTTVLINRLLYLIESKGVKTDNILLVTFTERGANELVTRADELLPYGYTDLWIYTFHGLADRILRDHGLDIGLPADYKILTQTEQWVFIKKNLAQLALDYYAPLGNPNKFISELIRHFSRLKDSHVSSEEYLAFAENLRQNKDSMLSGAPATADDEGEIFDARGVLDSVKIGELANAYYTYNRLLLANKFLDFGDLVNYCLKLLRERPAILKYYQDKFKYVLVDEFQDTNYAQYELIKLLAGPTDNLTAVGDDDQSIFKFRGASLSNIMQFKEDYPRAQEIVLTTNYRSRQNILDRAYEFIVHNNPNRLEAKLNLDKKLQGIRDGGEVKYLSFPTVVGESQAVAAMIKDLRQEGAVNWSDLAILVRANATADRFVEELKRQNIPAQFVSLKGLYNKPIILDILSYWRLLDNYHESGALYRVLNFDEFRVNHLDVVNILRFGKIKLWSLYESLVNVAVIPKISAESQANIAKLLASLKKYSQAIKHQPLSRVYVDLVRDIFLPHLNEPQHLSDYSYLNQLYKKIKAFEEASPSGLLPDFLELIDWELEAGDSGSLDLSLDDIDTVKVMTVHTAKGLEFKYVWLVDAVDKRFPTISRGEAIPMPLELAKEKLPEGDTHLEEERRLFYVAMTRAKEGLMITGARDHGGVGVKKPSKFVAEAGLSEEIIDKAAAVNELARDLQQTPAAAPSTSGLELPKRFSFSQLETYERCPWAYKYLQLLKIPLPPKPATTFGRVIHNTLRAWLAGALAGSAQGDLFGQAVKPELSRDKLLEIYEESWQDYGYANRAEAEDYRKLGREMLNNFYETWAGQSAPNVLWLEKKFYPRLGGELLDCTLDRVDQLPDGTVEIIDYKTGAPKPKPGFADKRQLLLYQVALEQLSGLQVSRLTYYYLKTGEAVSFTAKPADLEKINEWVVSTIKEIKSFDFTPRPAAHVCQYCDISHICEFRIT
jgi:DNA helicase-2/ATP-dependent DNA helicase PcrA